MSWEQFQAYAFPAAFTFLGLVILTVGKGIFRRLDTQDSALDRMEKVIALELRALDVRITVIETQLGMRSTK